MSVPVLLLVISLVQLVWLFFEWRRQGFFSALKLFVYGLLSAFAVYIQAPSGVT